ncbi:MAG: ComEC/Rec2 family competence protein [Chloroflexota bacterium]
MTLFGLGLAWLSGIATGQSLALRQGQWALLAAMAAAGVALYHRLPRFRLLFLGLALLFLGAARSSGAQPPTGPASLAFYNDLPGRPTLVGGVVAPPDVRDTYTGLKVAVESISFQPGEEPRPVRGLVWVRASRFESWEYGDRVEASGRLETPPVYESFSYRDYLARQGIYSLMPEAEVLRLAARQGNPLLQVIYALRSRTQRAILALFPEPESSLLSGILLGIESGIPPDVREAFNRTATSHIIAISGFNITLVAGLFVGLLGRWLGRQRGTLAAALAIGIYTLLVGAQASVVRAALMGGLSLLARSLGRRAHGLASLAAAATIMTAINPLALWDVGFQLSFAATLGLVLYADPLKRWLVMRTTARLGPKAGEKLAQPLSEFFLFTLAAQVTTLPLTLHYFHRLSLASWLANPAILPAQPVLMALGGAAALLGSVWLPLGQPLAWATWPFAAYTIRVVEFFARWRGASIALGPVTLPVIILLYLLLFGLTAWTSLPAERRRRILPWIPHSWRSVPIGVALAGLALAAVLVWTEAAARPDGRLHVTILDVGAGDATLIQTPTGRFVLIDGGSSPVTLAEALGRRMPPRARALDWLIVAGTDDDQLAGLVGLTERVTVHRVLLAGEPGGLPYQRLLQELGQRGIPLVPAQEGQRLDLGGGSLDVLALGRRGAALRLIHGRFSLLLAPGADTEMIAQLQQQPGLMPATAVLLPDGGAARLNPAPWLRQLQPWVALLSLQAGDRRGLPDPETLDALIGTAVLRTDHNGWIELTSDGERLWVQVERMVGSPAP